MGRGAGNQAIVDSGARGLLYGRRQRGSGPVIEPLDTNALDPDWHQFNQGLLDHLRAVNYINTSRIPFDSNQEIDQEVRHLVFFLPHVDGNNLTRLVAIDEVERRGLRISLADTSFASDDHGCQLKPGPTRADDLDRLEDYFVDGGRELGLSFVERTITSAELFSRLAAGQDGELSFNRWEEDNNPDLARRRLLDIMRAHQHGFDAADFARLRHKIETAAPEDYLLILANSALGQIILSRTQSWNLRRPTSD